MWIFHKAWQRSLSFSKKFRRDEDGIAALEFAIIALPFMALLFGVIELAIIFFLGSTLQSATYEASRLIRTGQFQAGDEATFKDVICRNMRPGSSDPSIASCISQMDVTVLLLSSFSQTTAFGDTTAALPIDPVTGDPINYTMTNGGDTVIVTATFTHPLNLPGTWTRLSNVNGENVREINTVIAFRNEPF